MKIKDLKKILKENYGFSCVTVVPGPRGFVAETFLVTTEYGAKVFVKYVDKPIFVQKVLKSVGVQHQIYANGFKRMNYPVMTLNKGFFIFDDGSILTVYNYIDAKQSYNYDLTAFGKLEAELHSQSILELNNIKKEDFEPQEALAFPDVLKDILNEESNDKIGLTLTDVFAKNKEQLDSDYEKFLILLGKCREQGNYNYVITHGDIGGNTLVKTTTDLYIIDWDEIVLAPAERDLWTFWRLPKFREGYLGVFPSFKINETLYHYYILMMHFSYIIHYINEIRGKGTLHYRQSTLKKMGKEITGGWILPYLEIARADC